MTLNSKVLAYIIAECERQGHDTKTPDGAQRVIWMAEAWEWARFPITERLPRGFDFAALNAALLVQHIGQRVELIKNDGGFRKVNVRVGSYVCPHWQDVPKLMAEWAKNLAVWTPQEAYRGLLEVHPFVDGNGRAAKIVLNLMMGTMDDPQMPPNFWNCANP